MAKKSGRIPSWATPTAAGVIGAGLGYWLGKRQVIAPAGQIYSPRPPVNDVVLRLRSLLSSVAPYYLWGQIPRAQTEWPSTCAQWLRLDPWSKWWVVSTALLATRSWNTGPGWYTNVSYPGGVWPRGPDILGRPPIPGAIDAGGYSVQDLIAEMDRQCVLTQQVLVVQSQPTFYPYPVFTSPFWWQRNDRGGRPSPRPSPPPPRGAPPAPPSAPVSTTSAHPAVSPDLFSRMNTGVPTAESDFPSGFVRPG